MKPTKWNLAEDKSYAPSPFMGGKIPLTSKEYG
jgi:hypothetical protein